MKVGSFLPLKGFGYDMVTPRRIELRSTGWKPVVLTTGRWRQGQSRENMRPEDWSPETKMVGDVGIRTRESREPKHVR